MLEGTCTVCGRAPEGYSCARVYAGGGKYDLLCSDCQLVAVRLLKTHAGRVPRPEPPRKARITHNFVLKAPQAWRCTSCGVITGDPYSISDEECPT